MFTVLCVVNLDLVVLSEHTHMATLEEAYQCPSGWMKYSVLLETVTCLSVVTMDGETTIVRILKMLVLSAVDQVCC